MTQPSEITKQAMYIDMLEEVLTTIENTAYTLRIETANEKIKEFLKEIFQEKIKTEKIHLKNLVNLEDANNDR